MQKYLPNKKLDNLRNGYSKNFEMHNVVRLPHQNQGSLVRGRPEKVLMLPPPHGKIEGQVKTILL